MGNEIFAYEAAFTNVTGTLYGNFNTTLQSMKIPAQAGAITSLTPKQWVQLDEDVATYAANAARLSTDPDRAATGELRPHNVPSCCDPSCACVRAVP
jgi:hypothetical protein